MARKAKKGQVDEVFLRMTKCLTLESKCEECGKRFEHQSGDWGYKIGEKKYCSFKCMRAAEMRG